MAALLLGAVGLATGALCAAAAQARSPLQIGAVVPELTVRSLVGSTIEAMTTSGLDNVGRVTLTWKRGQQKLDPGLLDDTRYAVQQAAASGIDIYLTLYPNGPSDTPRTPAARNTFALMQQFMFSARKGTRKFAAARMDLLAWSIAMVINQGITI